MNGKGRAIILPAGRAAYTCLSDFLRPLDCAVGYIEDHQGMCVNVTTQASTLSMKSRFQSLR